MPGKCWFQESWSLEDEFKYWLRPVDGKKHNAYCLLCKREFDIAKSGIYNVRLHAKGKKHLSFSQCVTSGIQRKLLFNSSSKDDESAGASSHSSPCPSKPTTSVPPSKPSTSSGNLLSFLNSDSVTKAEIMWASHSVVTNMSLRAASSSIDLFPVMFPDSAIAKRMQLHKDKIAYSVTYGLGPYFHNNVIKCVNDSPFFALSIDESLNDISQKEQLDVVVQYWNEDIGLVETRYLNSLFLEKSTASNIQENLLTMLQESMLPLEKLVQLSTDGPNVNLKLIADLRIHMKSTLPSGREILDVGTCSLHIVNGSYKTAMKKTGWGIVEFLSSLYRLFKNRPSRRASYVDLSGSSLFPKKFCSVRWTENSVVIERSLEMLPHLKKFVHSTSIHSHYFSVVSNSLKDSLLPAKLHFCVMMSRDLEGFLTNFQSNRPLLPFLHSEVFMLMKNLAGRVLKKSVLETVTNAKRLSEIDFQSKDVLKKTEDVDVGFGASSCLKKEKEINSLVFKEDCKRFIINIICNLLQKSPLKKSFVLGASCLSPIVLVSPNVRERRAKVAIEQLISHNQISAADGDYIFRDYKLFCDREVDKHKIVLQSFNWKTDRLDSTLNGIIRNCDYTRQFQEFVKIILVCFHGNAAVERSFSFNKNFLVENLSEKSLVAQRSLHDSVSSLPGGVLDLNVDHNMIANFRSASGRRKEALAMKKRAQEEAEEIKKKARLELQNLHQQKQILMEERTKELQSIDLKIKSLKKQL